MGLGVKQLLDWLNTYTFPQEARFADPAHADRMASWFLDQLISQGTTTVATYCSVHRTSAEALFTAAAGRDYRLIAGKVMMDRNAPAAVLDTPQAGYDDSKALIAAWHGKGRIDYAITPALRHYLDAGTDGNRRDADPRTSGLLRPDPS
ncbi:MAG: hypothetical protein V9G18_13930 [Albidovulum sp.]